MSELPVPGFVPDTFLLEKSPLQEIEEGFSRIGSGALAPIPLTSFAGLQKCCAQVFKETPQRLTLRRALLAQDKH
jgi:hypothetical protein